MTKTLPALLFEHLDADNLGHDRLEFATQHIEGLDQDEALQEVASLSLVRGFTAFYLGGVLSRIREHQWYQQLGYSGFGPFVEDYVGIPPSTAYDYIGIYHGLSESGTSWEKVEHVGWTKVRLFARYLTPDNVDTWVQAAEERTASELRVYVKEAVKQGQHQLLSPPGILVSTHVDTPEDDPKPTAVTTHAASPAADHPKQVVADKGYSAVEKAVKKNQLASKPPLVTTQAAEQTPISLTFKLYPEDNEVVEVALAQAQKQSGTTSKSKALSYICLDYLASTGHDEVVT